MNKEYINKLWEDPGIPEELKKVFRFGSGTMATGRFILAVEAGNDLESCSGSPVPTAIEKHFRGLSEPQTRAAIDINLLRQAIDFFDDAETLVVNLNVYARNDGSHYIEMIDRLGNAVFLCGMYPKEPDVSYPTLKQRLEEEQQ